MYQIFSFSSFSLPGDVLEIREQASRILRESIDQRCNELAREAISQAKSNARAECSPLPERLPPGCPTSRAFRDVESAKFACFPIREKSCQAPFHTRFSATPSLQTENKVEKMACLPP
jgi:hypothetical protein